MFFQRTALLFMMLLLAAPFAVAGDDQLWIPDFDKALEVAKKENKDLLVDFTGSDWCGWCIRLHDEVFGTELFKSKAPQQFVLTSLDFPHDEKIKAKVPNPARNQEIAQKFGINSYPTIVLTTSEGIPYAKTGYQPGGAEPYLAHLAEIRKTGRNALEKVSDLTAAIATAQGEERLALLEKAVAQLRELEEGSPLAVKLSDAAKEAMAADPDNAKGLKLKAIEALMTAGQADESVVAAAKTLDPRNEKGLLEKVVFAKLRSVNSEEGAKEFCKAVDELDALGEVKDAETAKQLYMYAARFHQNVTKDMVAAKKYAEKAKKYAGDDDRLKQMLDSIING